MDNFRGSLQSEVELFLIGKRPFPFELIWSFYNKVHPDGESLPSVLNKKKYWDVVAYSVAIWINSSSI